LSDRIRWPKPYRARAPNGDVLTEDTQSDLEDAVDDHAAQHGHQADYTVEREGRLAPQPVTEVEEDEPESENVSDGDGTE
jgi:hypothetical protein